MHTTNHTEAPFEVVLLAGGLGSRLSPITDDLPKPLVPVLGVPAITRLTSLLRENGWDKALMTVCAMPEAFEEYRDPNLQLEIVKGAVPLGSAGSVRQLTDHLAQTVLILSGDAVLSLTKPDALRSLYETHVREHRSATLLLARRQDPGEYGIVSLEEGRIVGFSEKPSWRDTYSDTVSTGIYLLDRSLLELIPTDLCYDFGKDLFPLLLSKGVPLHGELLPGRWWDIGTPQSYYRCCMELSGGESVIGKECLLAPNSAVKRSILFDRVTVGANALVENSILCRGVQVGEACVIRPGCVIGSDTVLEAGASVGPDVRLRGGLQVDAGATVGGRYRFGEISKRLFGDECISGSRVDLDCSFCLQLGRALKTPGVFLKVGVLHGASAGARLYAELLSRGAQDAGAQVVELRDAFPAAIGFAVREYGLDLAVFVELQESLGRVKLWFADKDGLPLSRQTQREITSRMQTLSFDRCTTPLTAVCPDHENRLLYRYCVWLQEQVGSLSGVSFAVTRRDDAGEFLFSNANSLGASVRYASEPDGMDSFTVSPSGTRACAYTASGKGLSYWHLVALAAAESDEQKIYLPARTPKTVEEYLQNMGKELHFYTDGMDIDRRYAHRTPYVQDGVLLCLTVAKQLQRRNETLEEALASLPVFFVRKTELPLPPDREAADRRAAQMASLTRNGCFPARIFRPTGCVSVFPNASGGYTLLAEATYGGYDTLAETADELCAEVEELFR